ncbi:MAG: peptidase M20, partial [Bacteroidota bacterium]
MRVAILLLFVSSFAFSQTKQPDWNRLQDETMRHFQAILRINSSTATGTEAPVVDYLKTVLEKEGIATKIFFNNPK